MRPSIALIKASTPTRANRVTRRTAGPRSWLLPPSHFQQPADIGMAGQSGLAFPAGFLASGSQDFPIGTRERALKGEEVAKANLTGGNR